MDNTPAFPANHFDLGATEHGMTLRDYFAAKAMQAAFAEMLREKPREGAAAAIEASAVIAYRVADAMMKARK
jgi:hypothetical protein